MKYILLTFGGGHQAFIDETSISVGMHPARGREATPFEVLYISKICYEKLNQTYTRWNDKIYGTAFYIITKEAINKITSMAQFNGTSFNILNPLNVADRYIYSNLKTYVYQYNFIGTLDESPTIHPEHLPLHAKSSIIQLETIMDYNL